MSFFNKPKEWTNASSNYERALLKLRDEKPVIGTDTKEKDGKFYVFNMEVSEKEYNDFLDQNNQMMDVVLESQRDLAA
jgi:3-dehydroquinate dehydratase